MATVKTLKKYKRKIPLDFDCGITITTEVIGGKWKTCLLDELSRGPKRPSELHRAFPDASSRVIDQKLKEMEVHGLIRKVIYPELPPRSEYFITDLGKSLLPVIRAMKKWGENYRPHMEKIMGDVS